MMKRIFAVVLLLVMMTFVGCGAVSDVQEDLGHSKCYSSDDMTEAMKTVRKHFRSMYNGCSLLTLSYAGDEMSKENLSYCRELEPKKDFVDCIVLESSFETGEHCDTSLEPNQTYADWHWYLAREKEGKWQLVMEGQG